MFLSQPLGTGQSSEGEGSAAVGAQTSPWTPLVPSKWPPQISSRAGVLQATVAYSLIRPPRQLGLARMGKIVGIYFGRR